MRVLLLVVGLLLSALTGAEGKGSLTNVGSVWKKSRYDCVIRALVEDPAGRLWAGTFGAGLLVRESGTWRQIASSPGGLPDPRISKILLADGELLVATAGGGAARLALPSLTARPLLPSAGEPASRHFHAFLALASGGFLLGSVGDGAFLGTPAGWVRLTESEGLPSNWINDALWFEDRLWLGTFFGLAVLDGPKIVRLELPEGSWSDGNINALTAWNGRLYLGTGSGGLYERLPPATPKKRARFQRVRGIPGQVHALLADSDVLWAATEEGLFRVAEDGQPFPVTGPWAHPSAFTSLGRASRGIVAGTDDGRIYYRGHEKTWQQIFDFQSMKQSGGQQR